MKFSYRFPGGKSRVLTFSYDDGFETDRQLVEILNRYGMKGTFNLNTDPWPGRVPLEEIRALYCDNGHEVACHGTSHPMFEKMPLEELVNEVRGNRLTLEQHTGRPVKGMAYPAGTFSPRAIDVLRACGILYARTTNANRKLYYLPADFMAWDPTAHHANDIGELADAFLKTPWQPMPLMCYIWGHSFEFDRNKNWNILEDFCKKLAGNADIWCATNMEIYEYLEAYFRLRFSADSSMVSNPSSQPVWIWFEGTTCEIPAGKTLKLF